MCVPEHDPDTPFRRRPRAIQGDMWSLDWNTTKFWIMELQEAPAKKQQVSTVKQLLTFVYQARDSSSSSSESEIISPN